MKTKYILLATAFYLSSFAVDAQTGTLKKDTVHVTGVCEMCKGRIEKAAKAAGAATAKWDPDTQILAVSYRSSGSSLTRIEKSVAEAGYDTANETATESAYGKLHKCCQYPRKASEAKETEVKTN